jgi:hypothetical protein
MPSLRSTRSLDGKKKDFDQQDSVDDEVEQLEPGLQEDQDDEIDEEEAETRCICGQLDPPDENGLFIQCEKCQVWQHGFCVSISDDVPEKYWCEKCRPDLHTIIVSSEGKISRYLPVMKAATGNGKRSRKRNPGAGQTANSDESEGSQKRRKERATFNSREDARYEALIQRVMEESKKEAQSDEKSDDEKSSTSGRTSRSSRRRGGSHNETNNDNNDGDDNGDTKSENEGGKTNGSDKDRSRKEKNSDTNDSAVTGNSTVTKRKPGAKRTRKAGPNSASEKENKDSVIDFNKPTKPRLPQQRSTTNEMRKRVAAILEFIGRTQIDIANEQKDEEELSKFVEDEKSKNSITVLFQNYNGSLELMDTLTRKLLIWEQKFGKYGEK